MGSFKNKLTEFSKDSTDIVIIFAVMGILVAMVLPVPAFLLDFLLALNITFAIIVLITTIYSEKALDFSVFPTMLLILTLFRLSLNVASTRLILIKGHQGSGAAGSVIESFGNFVVGGNYIVGMIIFIILVIINFMVITKGSGRIAEVAARFTLDAMPGKQMAIDADLNAGLIDENEARARRDVISRESEFHGAMDGASKFVKGDAIASIIITFINIVAGIIIGVFQKDLSISDALLNYTLLTIGDGLVSQIPALIISTSAGILVSRSGDESKMGKALYKSLFSKPTPIYVGASVVFLLGLVPGLPAVPFMGFSLILGIGFYFLNLKKDVEKKKEEEAVDKDELSATPEEVEHLLDMDLIEIEVGYGLIPLVDKSQDGSLLNRIRSIRRQFASELGIIVPSIHIRDNLKLEASTYKFVIKGVEVASGELFVGNLLAMDPSGTAKKIEGIPTKEPAFNLPAMWISIEKEEEAKISGYTVVDNSTVIATHLTETVKNYASELLGRQEVQKLLDNLAKTSPKAVEELVPNILTLGVVQKVLQNLLNERVSVRNLLTIVETLSDFATITKEPDILTEYVRQKLSRAFLSPYIDEKETLNVIILDKGLENFMLNSIKQTEQGAFMSIEPSMIEQIIMSVKNETEKNATLDIQPIVLCNTNLRRPLRRMIEGVAPSVIVTSHSEVPRNINIKSTGIIKIEQSGSEAKEAK